MLDVFYFSFDFILIYSAYFQVFRFYFDLLFDYFQSWHLGFDLYFDFIFDFIFGYFQKDQLQVNAQAQGSQVKGVPAASALFPKNKMIPAVVL